MHLVFVCARSSTSTQEVHSAKWGEWYARAVLQFMCRYLHSICRYSATLGDILMKGLGLSVPLGFSILFF